MKKIILSLCLLVSISTFARPAPLPLVSEVDIARFVGTWYTITSLPQFFTRNCEAQTTEYGIINEKTIGIHNVCYKKSGEVKEIDGIGVIQDASNNAKLAVTFNTFWTRLFRVKGDYNIIKLGDGYDTVMVGSNNRKSLWIMSRIPHMDPTTLLNYKIEAKALGFSTEQLRNAKY